MVKPAFPDHFSLFWSVYPTRNGKRLGKQVTKALFEKLSHEDQLLCVQAAIRYARDEQVLRGYARDPERFLKQGWWRDWLEPIAKQCLRCDASALPGFSRCHEHLVNFVTAWKRRDAHGLSHPRDLAPPTPEEISYVEGTNQETTQGSDPQASEN